MKKAAKMEEMTGVEGMIGRKVFGKKAKKGKKANC